MFEVNNGMAKINGKNGQYDDKAVTNPAEQYGRNAVQNFQSYIEKPIVEDKYNPAPILDFSLNKNAAEKNIEGLDKFVKANDAYLDSLPPLKFEYRYMPNVVNGKINKEALLAAANEEMDKRTEISVAQLDAMVAPSRDFSFKPLDINNDGKITNDEYSTSMLAADMLSKSNKPDFNNIDGTINQNGMNAVMAYAKKSNADAAKALYSNIYNKYNLGR